MEEPFFLPKLHTSSDLYFRFLILPSLQLLLSPHCHIYQIHQSICQHFETLAQIGVDNDHRSNGIKCLARVRFHRLHNCHCISNIDLLFLLKGGRSLKSKQLSAVPSSFCPESDFFVFLVVPLSLKRDEGTG